MLLLNIALLIQILYYVVMKAHIFIIVFILVSLFSMLFIKNKILVILTPMLLTHVLFIIFNRKNKKENFRKWKKRFKVKKFVFGPNYKQKYEIVKDERDSERRINETNADTLKKVNEESKK